MSKARVSVPAKGYARSRAGHAAKRNLPRGRGGPHEVQHTAGQITRHQSSTSTALPILSRPFSMISIDVAKESLR